MSDAERAVLGGMIMDPERIDDHPLQPADFADGRNAMTYLLLRDMRAQGDAIDMVTLPTAVARSGQADRFGGIAYVLTLPDAVPSPAAVPAYVVEVRRESLRRRAREALTDALASLETGDPTRVSADVTTTLEGLTAEGNGAWRKASKVIESSLEDIHRRADPDAQGERRMTGFPSLDDVLVSLDGGRLYVVAARPGMGKSTLVQEIAANVARAGSSVGLFLLEMAAEEMGVRMLASSSSVHGQALRRGTADDHEFERVLDAADGLAGLPIWFCDAPNMSIADVIAAAKQLKHRCDREGPPLGLVALDYLQLMDIQTRRGENRTNAVGEVSRKCKLLARALDVPVVLLSQLNRSCEARPDKRPQVSDLRDSGAIEQDADAVLLMFRPAVYDDTAPVGDLEVIVGKNRCGPTCTVQMEFRGECYRIEERRGAWG